MFIPLMPEGVEHMLTLSSIFGTIFVFIPLMPEGVEHDSKPYFERYER